MGIFDGKRPKRADVAAMRSAKLREMERYHIQAYQSPLYARAERRAPDRSFKANDLEGMQENHVQIACWVNYEHGQPIPTYQIDRSYSMVLPDGRRVSPRCWSLHDLQVLYFLLREAIEFGYDAEEGLYKRSSLEESIGDVAQRKKAALEEFNRRVIIPVSDKPDGPTGGGENQT